MSRDRAKPADVLLDLLRGAGSRGRSSANLVEMGALFGFTANTVRVTLSRLQARQVIECPERGEYRLAETADPVNEFVELWRLGEQRVRSWDEATWMLAHLPESTDKAVWALVACGFRQAGVGLWVRPDNLARSPAALRKTLVSIGLPESAALVVAKPVHQGATDWRELWDAASLDGDYQSMHERLEASRARLAALDIDAARIETFKLGGEAIHLLSKDPLLPSGFVNVQARESLWQAMIEYDALGKEIWAASRREQDNSLPIPRLANEG